ncbi:hypothetical protein DSO57_1018505 [Entomophthora muscae]|uniref:Uncharacterized protein n=1 Tax=Entomophthora muscae TaxID=34485 RepID=A0ACC2SH12_9FUNG|nr:hypothetical protein DSO57_1018505 [Entomophthora muscae]
MTPKRIYKPPTQSRSRAPDHDPSSAEEYLASHTGVYSKVISLKSRLTHLLALDKYMLAPLSIILQEDPLDIRQELDEIAVETDGVYRLNLSEYLNVDVAGFRGYSHKDRIKATGNCHTAFNLARLPSSIPQRRALEAFYGEAGIIPYSTPEAPPEETRAKKEAKASPKQSQKISSPLKSMKAVSSSKPAPVARPKPMVASSKASSAKAAARPRVTEPDSSPIDEPRVSGSKSKRSRVESSAQPLSPKRTKKAVLSQEEAPRAMLRQTSRNSQEELRVTQKQASRGYEEDPRATQRQLQRGQEDSRTSRQAPRSQIEDLRSSQRQPQRAYEDARPIQRQISRNQEDLRSMQRTRTRVEESGTQRQPTLNSRASGLTSNDGLLHPKPSRSSRHVPSKALVLGSAFRKLNKEYKTLRTFFLRNRMAIDKHLEEAKSTSTNEAKLEDLTKRIKTFVSNAEEASFHKKRLRFDDLQSQLLDIRKKLNDHLKALA